MYMDELNHMFGNQIITFCGFALESNSGTDVYIFNILCCRKTSQSRTVISPTTEDGHAWRKYGQKDILHAKYPRYLHVLLSLYVYIYILLPFISTHFFL